MVLFLVFLFLGCEASLMDHQKRGPNDPPPFPIIGREGANSTSPFYGTGTGTAALAPTSSPKPMPTEMPKLACHGLNNTYWAPLDEVTKAIKDYCAQPDLNTHDPNSGSRQRFYNKDTVTEMSIAIDWPPGSDIELSQDDCLSHLTMIVNNCDGNSQQNSLDWKHGGNLTVDPIIYHVDPIAERYYAGKMLADSCSVTVKECPQNDGSVTTTLAAYDSINMLFAADSSETHDIHDSYTLPHAFYAPLSITPGFLGPPISELNANVQFQIGDQVWSVNDTQRFGVISNDSTCYGFSLNFDC